MLRRLFGCFLAYAMLSGQLSLLNTAAAQDASSEVSKEKQILPFPQNRVRDFYAAQARKYLSSDREIPKLLPDFPGMDGGSFGHWGQNPEADNFDSSLNEVDYGGALAQVTRHFGRTTEKGVSVVLGDDGGITAIFDPRLLTFVDTWEGDLVRWRSSRFGITSGVEAVGEQLMDLSDSRWVMPDGTKKRYLGYYRSGRRVVFVYEIGGARVFDHMWQLDGQPTRSISVQGGLPDGVELEGTLSVVADEGQTLALTTAAQPQWTDQPVMTTGHLGEPTASDADVPYVVDTLTIPYGKANPFGVPMRIGGLDFLPDGRAVVCTLAGDVWLIRGVNQALDCLTWRRFAAGLNQPLGLVVKDGKVLVLGRDQITRLHDNNDDGEADYYECVTHDFPTAAGNNFALTLHKDVHGTLYWFTRSAKFGVTRFREGSQPESIATGLRGTNGTGVSPNGTIVLATVQEGTWTPATAIFEVGHGSYHGFFGPKKELGRDGYQMPLCFVPRGIDNSAGDIAFLPDDVRLGPLAGKTFGTSFGYCQSYLILREQVGDSVQGGVVPLPFDFLSGVHRSRFNERDGHLYLAGTDGWQSYAKENGSLQRVRYVGGQMAFPTAIETYENGLLIRFNSAIDPQSVSVQNVFCEQWNYLYSQAYGSPEYSVVDPARRGHDHVPVQSVVLLPDSKSVFVEIPHLHPVMQFHVYMQLRTGDGRTFSPDVYCSIFAQRKPFTKFAGYTNSARRKRYPGFPIAEQFPRDTRVVAQEALGKTTNAVVAVEVDTVPGLKFEPRRLRVPPGRRIGLTVRNTDPSMPHNFVLVQPDRLQAIGEGAMLLAADPRGIATHYAPMDPGVICLSPILNPDDQYTIYFDSPKQKGAYPFVCTFPGHWQVMQGVLHIADEDDELPIETFAPTREFVKMWMTGELAADADQLGARSFSQGQKMFTEASCIKCHTFAGKGAKLGPDLSFVTKRFKGAKLLQQILEPSSDIHTEYQSYVVLTDEGEVITGLMVKDEPNAIRLLPNPLKPDETIRIPREQIDEMTPSKVSTMPKGLLMTLSRDEILDLLFFLESGHSADHASASASNQEQNPLAKQNLVAWCIVPFDAKKRGPAARAQMIKRLGLRRVAYDWRAEHVPTFEEEILQYAKHGIEYFAFWSWHDAMEPLIGKHGITPQIWQTVGEPNEDSQQKNVAAAAKSMLPLVERTRRLGLKLGLYNHGGWSGEPANLVAVCEYLRTHHDGGHVGIVYNFHHGHGHIPDFAESLRQMRPYLLCLNLNGMDDPAASVPFIKIKPIGEGTHENRMIQTIIKSGYSGPIGILGHRADIDVERALKLNLDGLEKLLDTNN